MAKKDFIEYCSLLSVLSLDGQFRNRANEIWDRLSAEAEDANERLLRGDGSITQEDALLKAELFLVFGELMRGGNALLDIAMGFLDKATKSEIEQKTPASGSLN